MSGSRERVPERLRWAVQHLGLRPGDDVCEIGCGPGVALSLIVDRLQGGRVVGVDRSATAIRRAAARNARPLAAGTVELVQAELSDLTLPGRCFDVVLAVNVNLFWVRPASGALQRIRALLREGGALHLCYEAPDRTKGEAVAHAVTTAVEAAEAFRGVRAIDGGAAVCIEATAAGGFACDADDGRARGCHGAV